MASSELTGIVKRVGQTEQVSDAFKKRELWIEIDGETQYPQTIQIEAAQEKCEDPNLKEIKPGDEITVHFNYRGRIWNDPKKNKDVVFNTLQFWKLSINRTSAGNNSQQPAAQQQAAYQPPAFDPSLNDDSDLPF